MSDSERDGLLALARERGWAVGANDERAVLSKGTKVLALTFDHKGRLVSAKDGDRDIHRNGMVSAVARILRRRL